MLSGPRMCPLDDETRNRLILRMGGYHLRGTMSISGPGDEICQMVVAL